MFPREVGEFEPNVIAIRVQPDEGISLRFQTKVPGIDLRMKPVDMDFSYREAFTGPEHSAYETLLVDCMTGDATLFARRDEVESAWAVVDPIIEAWEARHGKIPRRAWVVVRDGKELLFCEPDCERIYDDYCIPRYGATIRWR